MQRGATPRVYRNMLVFLAAEARQLDSLKESVRAAIAWSQIVKDATRLNLPPSDSALAAAKSTEANETMKTRLKEAWCYLICPMQETAQSEVEWTSGKIPAQDGVLSRASKKLVSDEALMPKLGPARLDRDLRKYIWSDKPHLLLKDLWEYLNRYTYLPRLKNQAVLVKAVQASITGMLPGPFAYAERWDEADKAYRGVAIDKSSNVPVVIDSESVIIAPGIALAYFSAQAQVIPVASPPARGVGSPMPAGGVSAGSGKTETPGAENLPTRFVGTVMISADRPARDIHQIVEAIVEQLTTLPGCEVALKLEIDAEAPAGLDRAKVRTLLENATTLGFIDKIVS
ncbi:hypothetical protein ABIB82_006467 [Bradyrhizobium sp. i1.8.4]